MTDPDLTTQEQVNKSIGTCRLHGLYGTAATLRALSAALAAANQAARYESDLAEQALQEMHAHKARAEALDAKLKEAVVKIKARIPNPVESQWDAGAKAGLIYAHEMLASIEGDKPDE